MKKTLSNISLACAFMLLPLISNAEEEKQELFSIGVPTTVKAIEEKYGAPYNIEFPSEEELTWGTMLEWKIEESGVLLTAVSDEYNPPKPNHNASISVISLKALNITEAPSTIYGIELNKTTCTEISKTLKEEFSPSTYATIKFSKDEIVTYFSCNRKDVITEVTLSDYDIDTAS